MNRKLENKIAVVTGGSAGIGLGVAKRFAGEGARVFITGRRQFELDKALATVEGNVTAIQGDASKLADIDRIYETVKTQAGRIDVLLVNAGFYEVGRLGEITEDHFDKTFNTNVRGLVFTVQKALPLLSPGSSVILRLQSLLAQGPVILVFYRGGWCPYCNLHLRGFQRALPELQQLGTQIVAISPQLPDNSLSTQERMNLLLLC